MTLPSDSQQANHDAKVDGSTSPEYELLGRFEPRDRVLQKCGFKIIGKNKDFANGRGQDTEEYIHRLDLDQANE
jgi:hypothetical protein